MHRLFKARIAERSQLIENAARGEVSNSKVGEVMKPPTDRSMPGGTPLGRGIDAGGNLEAGHRRGGHAVAGADGGRGVVEGAHPGAPSPEAPDTVVEVLEVLEVPPEPKVIPAVVEKSSSIAVETEPAGASVTVDGKAAGVAPLTVPEVTAGEHVIEASLAGYTNVKKHRQRQRGGRSADDRADAPAEEGRGAEGQAQPEHRPVDARVSQREGAGRHAVDRAAAARSAGTGSS